MAEDMPGDMADDDGRTAARPRCDGVYAARMRGANGDHGWNYLRFHPDGRVTAAWAKSGPEAIAPQLTPDRDELDQGYVKFDREVFGFTTVSRRGEGDWAGVVQEDGSLFVRSVSKLDEQTTDETYAFHHLG